VRWLDRFLTMLPLAGQHDPEHDHRQDADQPDDADHPGACSDVAVFPGSGTLLECSVNPGLDELSSIRLGEDPCRTTRTRSGTGPAKPWPRAGCPKHGPVT
jgi:hypothetical protein